MGLLNGSKMDNGRKAILVKKMEALNGRAADGPWNDTSSESIAFDELLFRNVAMGGGGFDSHLDFV